MARAWAGRVGRSGIAFEQRRASRRRTRHEERGMARVAIVTGGTRGIGEAISLALKEAGMTVAANYAGNDERAKAFTDRTGIKAYKRSEEHTSELQSLMRISYAVFCLQKQNKNKQQHPTQN